MKPKTRKIPYEEYRALYMKVREAGMIYNKSGVQCSMITGDFTSTQNLSETRWILFDCADDCLLFQVDGVGDAILLISE